MKFAWIDPDGKLWKIKDKNKLRVPCMHSPRLEQCREDCNAFSIKELNNYQTKSMSYYWPEPKTVVTISCFEKDIQYVIDKKNKNIKIADIYDIVVQGSKRFTGKFEVIEIPEDNDATAFIKIRRLSDGVEDEIQRHTLEIWPKVS